MKRICVVGTVLLLSLLLIQTAFAYEARGQKVYDEAGLLTEREAARLEEALKGAAEEKKLDVIVVTTTDTEGMGAELYADLFYNDHGFGYEGPEGTGILFLIDMDDREAYISTCGDAIDYFTDQRLDTMLDAITPHLSVGDYYGACQEFTDYVLRYMGRDPNAGPTLTERFMLSLRRSPLYLGIALVIGGVYVWTLIASRGGKDTTNYRTYQANNGFHLVQRDDFFLRETVTSRRIQQPGPGGSGRSGGGGSSSGTHTSGGVRHGGAGRKF